eukprot:Rhum_TRINITY_DN14380_c0_g1::Rhum_TRINITY_DN14380_c0_g1_i1::g.84424::m.84424
MGVGEWGVLRQRPVHGEVHGLRQGQHVVVRLQSRDARSRLRVLARIVVDLTREARAQRVDAVQGEHHNVHDVRALQGQQRRQVRRVCLRAPGPCRVGQRHDRHAAVLPVRLHRLRAPRRGHLARHPLCQRLVVLPHDRPPAADLRDELHRLVHRAPAREVLQALVRELLLKRRVVLLRVGEAAVEVGDGERLCDGLLQGVCDDDAEAGVGEHPVAERRDVPVCALSGQAHLDVAHGHRPVHQHRHLVLVEHGGQLPHRHLHAAAVPHLWEHRKLHRGDEPARGQVCDELPVVLVLLVRRRRQRRGRVVQHHAVRRREAVQGRQRGGSEVRRVHDGVAGSPRQRLQHARDGLVRVQAELQVVGVHAQHRRHLVLRLPQPKRQRLEPEQHRVPLVRLVPPHAGLPHRIRRRAERHAAEEAARDAREVPLPHRRPEVLLLDLRVRRAAPVDLALHHFEHGLPVASCHLQRRRVRRVRRRGGGRGGRRGGEQAARRLRRRLRHGVRRLRQLSAQRPQHLVPALLHLALHLVDQRVGVQRVGHRLHQRVHHVRHAVPLHRRVPPTQRVQLVQALVRRPQVLAPGHLLERHRRREPRLHALLPRLRAAWCLELRLLQRVFRLPRSLVDERVVQHLQEYVVQRRLERKLVVERSRRRGGGRVR